MIARLDERVPPLSNRQHTAAEHQDQQEQQARGKCRVRHT
jgi:hypothetical protein